MPTDYTKHLTSTETNQSASASRTHDFDVSRCGRIAVQFIYESFDTETAYLRLHGSLDGINFDLFEESYKAILDNSGNIIYSIDVDAINVIRLEFNRGSNTTGTYSLLAKTEYDLS